MKPSDLLKKTYHVPNLEIKRPDDRQKYITVIHTPKGDQVQIKPEVMRRIKKRLERGF